MTKVKVVEHKRIEKEIDLEYPVYLYFQDEDCHDEYVKDHCIRIKYDYFSISLSKDSNFHFMEHYVKDVISEDLFNEAMKEVLEYLI